jgi:hypothetical protein
VAFPLLSVINNITLTHSIVRRIKNFKFLLLVSVLCLICLVLVTVLLFSLYKPTVNMVFCLGSVNWCLGC